MQEILNIIGLISSIAALILAIVAIWLSFKFFEKSNEASEKTNEAAKGISYSVEKLEKLFDKLYSDTFSVMKDTVSDMRKHLWTNRSGNEEHISKIEKETEKKAETKIAQIKNEINKEVSFILRRQHRDRQVTEDKIASLQTEIQKLMDKAISESRTADTQAKEETLRELITKTLQIFNKNKKIATSENIIEWAIEEGLNPRNVIKEIELMGKEGILELSENKINDPYVRIKLK